MENTNKRIYKISRIILAIFTFIIFSIILFYEADSLFFSSLFALITYGVSFPSSFIAKKIIDIGNKIENKIFKLLYYSIVLPIIVIVLIILTYTIIIFISDNYASLSLSQALFGLFLIIVGAICIIVPFAQSLIVLILRKFIKE